MTIPMLPPRRSWRKKRERLWRDSGGVCFYCRRPTLLQLPSASVPHDPGMLATIEHLVPKSQGGGNNRANLVLACIRCNLARGGTTFRPPRPGRKYGRGVGPYPAAVDLQRWTDPMPPPSY